MANIHEMYARLAVERQDEHEAHLRTIALLADLKAGRVLLAQVEVSGDGWRIHPRNGADVANGLAENHKRPELQAALDRLDGRGPPILPESELSGAPDVE